LKTLPPLAPGHNWTPAAPSTTGKYLPRTGYGLAVVNGGNTVGMTRRGETHWGVVAGHFRFDFKKVMRFEEFLALVLPAVEEERLDAQRHAEALPPSFARGYLLGCHDGNKDMMEMIGNTMKQLPEERVGFVNACTFNDPLEAERQTPNASPATVIAIAAWLRDRPLKALWHKSAAAGCINPNLAPERLDGIPATRDASIAPMGVAGAAY